MKFSLVIFAFLALGVTHSCGSSKPRDVKPKPEFWALVPSGLAGGTEQMGRLGFEYEDEFSLSVQFVFDASQPQSIDLLFDCWLAEQPLSFGVSRTGTAPFVHYCDPISVPEPLDGLEIIAGRRGENSGLGAFVRQFENNDIISFTYASEDFLSLEGHFADGEVAITKPTDETGLPLITALALQRNAEGKRKGMSIYDAYGFAPTDIRQLRVTLRRQ